MTTSIVTTDCADVLLPDAVAAARVVFVGAGPGDPGLMTVRSREVRAPQTTRDSSIR